MTAGFTVDVSALRSLAQDLQGVETQAAQIARAAGNADVTDLAWGLIGQLTRSVFGEVLGRSQDGLGELQRLLDHASHRLAQAADAYQSIGQEVEVRMTAILEELDIPLSTVRGR